jgi:hypothetical protein
MWKGKTLVDFGFFKLYISWGETDTFAEIFFHKSELNEGSDRPLHIDFIILGLSSSRTLSAIFEYPKDLNFCSNLQKL